MESAVDFDRLHEQIETTAHANGITIQWMERPLLAWAARKELLISIPRITDLVRYAIALHELGHKLGADQDGSDEQAELGAWAWAHANALIWTDVMEAFAARSLAGDYALPPPERSRNRLPIFPPIRSRVRG